MTKCVLCPNPIEPGTRAVSIVGGLFPESDPDFFMIDESVLIESYVHLECLLKRTAETKNDVVSPASDTDGTAGDV